MAQCNAMPCSHVKNSAQRDSNSQSCDPKSGVLTTRPLGRFLQCWIIKHKVLYRVKCLFQLFINNMYTIFLFLFDLLFTLNIMTYYEMCYSHLWSMYGLSFGLGYRVLSCLRIHTGMTSLLWHTAHSPPSARAFFSLIYRESFHAPKFDITFQ